jgi:hypothetical protein
MEAGFVAEAPPELCLRELIADDESILGSMDDRALPANREWSLEPHFCMDMFTRCISAWV